MEQRAERPLAPFGLEVVRVFDEAAQLKGDPQRLFGAHRAARDGVGKVFALQILHRDVEIAAVGAVLVDLRHPAADRRELLLEERAALLRLEDLLILVAGALANQLQREVRAGSRVARKEHDGHAAAADLVFDLVGTDPVEDGHGLSARPGAGRGPVRAGRRDEPVVLSDTTRSLRRQADTFGRHSLEDVSVEHRFRPRLDGHR